LRYRIWIISGLAILTGCSNPYVTSERLERGLVIVLPGIEGRSSLNEAIVEGLNDGGVNWAIELYDWTSPLGPLYNLRAEDRNRQKAHQIVNRIVRYHWEYPDRPVVILGQSGGSAIAAWAAEAMPRGHILDGVVMLAPSLSPRYMLDFALENTERGIISLYSERDWVLLGLGTTIAGTMDGAHTSSAGRTGFEMPVAGGRPEIYQKLYQVSWQPKMRQTGNVGMHLTSGARAFVSMYVAPYVLSDKWDEELVARVLNGQWKEDQRTQHMNFRERM